MHSAAAGEYRDDEGIFPLLLHVGQHKDASSPLSYHQLAWGVRSDLPPAQQEKVGILSQVRGMDRPEDEPPLEEEIFALEYSQVCPSIHLLSGRAVLAVT